VGRKTGDKEKRVYWFRGGFPEWKAKEKNLPMGSELIRDQA